MGFSYEEGIGAVATAIRVIDLGCIGYPEAYQIQQQCVEQALKGGDEALILCEHPPVITLGRTSKPENIFLSDKELAARGIEVRRVDRGGDVTLHVPGQLVVYPILNLAARDKDLKKYLFKLEEVAIDFLRSFGILADRFPGHTGVWFHGRKIVSIGVGVKKWVTYHGLGININTNLSYFQLIRPCGLDVSMASVNSLTGKVIDLDLAKNSFVGTFRKEFSQE